MLTLTPFILFDGTCRQAMQFYQSCLGGELTLLAVKDSPASGRMPPSLQDRIIHARLRAGALDISASDWLSPDRVRVPGNTVCLWVSGGSRREIRHLFEKLSEGADITDPLSEQFFGTYGALNDGFGVRWMFGADRQSQE